MILHADADAEADAFFASVEQRDDPQLRGRPVALCVDVVFAASYEARDYGVRGGMPVRRALRCCPALVCVQPRSEAYLVASRQLFDLSTEITRLVEPGSMEEAFLDVGDLPADDAIQVATDLRRRARESVGIPVSIGVARTKLLAKVASRRAKPDGLFVLALDEEVAFRNALRIDQLWGVGPATIHKLHSAAVDSVADLVTMPETDLIAMVGPAMGRRLYAIASGCDDDPVRPNRLIQFPRRAATSPVERSGKGTGRALEGGDLEGGVTRGQYLLRRRDQERLLSVGSLA